MFMHTHTHPDFGGQATQTGWACQSCQRPDLLSLHETAVKPPSVCVCVWTDTEQTILLLTTSSHLSKAPIT